VRGAETATRVGSCAGLKGAPVSIQILFKEERMNSKALKSSIQVAQNNTDGFPQM
jgi:hypothetical protein